MSWYSGTCKRLCLVEGTGAIVREESVYVFRADTDAEAKRRLLELAREAERDERNAAGQRVRWVVVSLDTLDELTDGDLSGTEVFSKWVDIDPPDLSVAFGTQFAPEKSEPGSSGVGLVTRQRPS